MKKFALALALVFALTLCMGAFSVSAADNYVIYSNKAGNVTMPGAVAEPSGYLRVDTVGSGNDATESINEDGTITFGSNTNWATEGVGNNTCNGSWWAAPAMAYSTAVTANQIAVCLIDGDTTTQTKWDGTDEFYTGDFTTHKVLCADDPNGVWTELEFSAEAVAHDGTYFQADWGYAGGILVYSFEEVTAKYFIVMTGTDAVQFGCAYAALAPEASEDTQAPETQAPETQAPATQAPATQAPETQAPETEGDNADTADFAIASLALAAVAAAGVVLTKKRK